jgi:cytochrome c oxidase assembly factor CtaG
VVPHAVYGYYAALANRPGGISALTDQQIAAGVMWVPGSLSYALTFIIGFYRWLEPDRSASPRPAAFTT